MYPINKYKFYTYTVKGENGEKISCVSAVSSYAGKTVKGTAKCHPNDVFDYERGKKLAALRCGQKIAKKRVARATARMDEAIRLDEKLKKFKLDSARYMRDAQNELNAYNCQLSELDY